MRQRHVHGEGAPAAVAVSLEIELVRHLAVVGFRRGFELRHDGGPGHDPGRGETRSGPPRNGLKEAALRGAGAGCAAEARSGRRRYRHFRMYYKFLCIERILTQWNGYSLCLFLSGEIGITAAHAPRLLILSRKWD